MGGAITPYTDLGSEDILSAHISALQANINKLETILNMATSQVISRAMNPVADQTDQTLRYKIYEGVDRNWLTSPAPQIYRNGTVVDSSEFTLHAAQGAVVFLNQQQSTDVITYDATIITGASNRLTGLEYLTKHYIGQYRSHGIGINGGVASNGVLNNTIDIFPFRVYEPITVDYMGIQVNTAVAGSLVAMALYSDNNGYPGSLIAQTGQLSSGTSGWSEGPFTAGDQVLQPGLYWVARWNFTNGGSPSFAGLTSVGMYPVPSAPSYGSTSLAYSSSLGGGGVIGLRYTYTWASSFPSVFPAIGTSGLIWLDRTSAASPWVRRKS